MTSRLRVVFITLSMSLSLVLCENPAFGDTSCSTVYDIAIAVDTTETTRDADCQSMRSFIVAAASRLNIGSDRSHLAVVTLGQRTEVVFHLSSSIHGLQTALLRNKVTASCKGDRGNAAGGPKLLYRKVFNGQNGDRKDISNLVVLLLSGRSSVSNDRAAQLKKKGTRIVVIAVTNRVDEVECENLASSKDDVIFVKEFTQLNSTLNQLVKLSCEGRENGKGGKTSNESTLLVRHKRQGTSGATGTTGLAGSTGVPGATGASGLPGVTGNTGATGPIGPVGIRGLSGATGYSGLPGIPGKSGATGYSGLPGVPGSTGATGPIGPAGIRGQSGATGYSGLPGVPGSTGATGPIGPAGIRGQSGATGYSGLPGVPGKSGATGYSGLPGVPGNTGATGVSGRSGATGISGSAGNTGATGATGSPGPVSIVDKCLANNGGCQHKCQNTPESYYCTCNKGFQIQNTGFVCNGISFRQKRSADGIKYWNDDWQTIRSRSKRDSDFHTDKYFCGYFPDAGGMASLYCFCKINATTIVPVNGTQCVDINECSYYNGGCAQTCINTQGSYSCSCETGLKLTEDKHGCTDVDECKLGTSVCSAQSTCINTLGSYVCIQNNNDSEWKTTVILISVIFGVGFLSSVVLLAVCFRFWRQ